MLRHRRRAVLAGGLALLCGCSPASTGRSAGGDEPSAPVAWKFESVSWYNRYSMSSTIGPLVVGQTVLYGGTYGYQNTKASTLAALDGTTGMVRWRMEYAAEFGPMVLQGGTIAVGTRDSVLGLDVASGAQRWTVPVRPRSLTAAGDVVLAAERETIHAIDPVSGSRRWQVRSTSDPFAAGDAALFMDGRTLRAVAAGSGALRWSLELPAALAYPQSLLGDHLYVLGAVSLASVNLKSRNLEWAVALVSAPTAGIAAADDTLYFTTQSPQGSYVFHAFDPATQRDRWSHALDSSSRVAPIVMGSLVATAANGSVESLVALSRGTGMVVWSARAGSVPVQPVLKGTILYVAGQGPNRVYAFETRTGAVLWSGRLWGWPMGMALTEDGTLLVSADNLTLYAYRTQ